MKSIIYYYIFHNMNYTYINLYDIEKINYYKYQSQNENNKITFLERNIFKDKDNSYIKIYHE